MGRSAHTDEVTRRMFVATADGNYMLARVAYEHALDTDFWWLSMHAVEKYLKAILLLNGRSSIGPGHNLIKLHDAVRRLDPKVAFGPFVDPRIAQLHWRQCTVEDFLRRLAEYGSAANRYMTYGHTASPEDLAKVDQLVFAARRHCTPFKVELGGEGQRHTIDWLQQLVDRPDTWRLNGTLPLERVIARDQSDALRQSVIRLNVPFDPGATHSMNGYRISASNPPLTDWIIRLRAPNPQPGVRETSAEVLRWVLDNIQFGNGDKALIERELAAAGFAPVACPLPWRKRVAASVGTKLIAVGRRLHGEGQANRARRRP